MKIKTNNVPQDCDYLTNGKEYEVLWITTSGRLVRVFDDNNKVTALWVNNCPDLNGESWEIVSE